MPDGEPQAQGTASDLGSFLVMLHWGLPASASEAIYFPDVTASPSAASLQDSAIDQLPMCHFTVPSLSVKEGEFLVLCGDIAELGSWDPTKGLKMESQGGESWMGKIRLPASATFDAKVES